MVETRRPAFDISLEKQQTVLSLLTSRIASLIDTHTGLTNAACSSSSSLIAGKEGSSGCKASEALTSEVSLSTSCSRTGLGSWVVREAAVRVSKRAPL